MVFHLSLFLVILTPPSLPLIIPSHFQNSPSTSMSSVFHCTPPLPQMTPFSLFLALLVLKGQLAILKNNHSIYLLF